MAKRSSENMTMHGIDKRIHVINRDRGIRNYEFFLDVETLQVTISGDTKLVFSKYIQ